MISRSLSISSRDVVMNEQQIGPFFLGIIINYLLWGIQITQSYYYYKTYRKTDRTWFKVAVGVLFVTDALGSVVATETGWSFMVDAWGDFDKVILVSDWGIHMVPLIDTFTASIVHVFYAHKIWKLLDAPYNHISTAIVLSLSCMQLVAGIGCTSLQFATKMAVVDFARIKTWSSIWLITASVTDIVITILMTWKLSKSRTGFQRTDDIISKLVRLTVETGMATSVVQIADIVIYLIWPVLPYHVTLTYMTPKVYSNSMLAVLNSRQQQQSGGGGVWDSRQGSSRPNDSIGVNTTTQTVVSITNANYELNDRIKPGYQVSRSRYDDRNPREGDSFDRLPFDDKERV